jgi:hypothetical protein
MVGNGAKEIVLVEHFDGYVEPAPVLVPMRVVNYHPRGERISRRHGLAVRQQGNT